MSRPLAKLLTAGALASAAFFSSTAALAVGAPVTIQESSIAGAAANQYVADQLSGQYDEIFSVTGFNPVTGQGTFVTEAIFTAGNWFRNSNPIAGGTQLNAFGAAGYGLYAKFQATGSFSVSGTTLSFNGATAALELWSDANSDTNYDIAGSATGNISNLVLASGAASITDDRRLGSTSVLSIGGGNGSTTGVANGNFELIFSQFNLDADGLNYFTAPRPFYLILDLNGNFQNFDPTSATNIQILASSANAFFAVPEPSALALVGLALIGAAVTTRRRVK